MFSYPMSLTFTIKIKNWSFCIVSTVDELESSSFLREVIDGDSPFVFIDEGVVTEKEDAL